MGTKPSAFLLCAALFAATGCSTIVNRGRPAGIDVRSDPPGADIFGDGVRKGLTPMRVELDPGVGEHAVRIEKSGYGSVERTVAKQTDPWVWGNAPFVILPPVAAAGFGIDSWTDHWYRFEPTELDVALPLGPTPGPARKAPAGPPHPAPKNRRGPPRSPPLPTGRAANWTTSCFKFCKRTDRSASP